MPFPFAFWQGGYGSRGPDFMSIVDIDFAGGMTATFSVRNPMATNMNITWAITNPKYNTPAPTLNIEPGEVRVVGVSKVLPGSAGSASITFSWTSSVYSGTKDCTNSYSYISVSDEPTV